MREKKIKRGDLIACTYCGEVKPGTEDHIPPQTIYNKPKPANRPWVWACRDCNNGASNDDTYFRDTIIKDRLVGETPQAKQAVDKMLGAMKLREQAGYTRAQMNALQEVAIYSPAGLYLGHAPITKIDAARLQRTICRYVRGMHAFEHGEIAVDERRVRVVFNPEKVREDFDKKWAPLFNHAPLKVVQDKVFAYKTILVPGEKDSSFWLFIFYDAVPVVALVHLKTPASTLSLRWHYFWLWLKAMFASLALRHS